MMITVHYSTLHLVTRHLGEVDPKDYDIISNQIYSQMIGVSDMIADDVSLHHTNISVGAQWFDSREELNEFMRSYGQKHNFTVVVESSRTTSSPRVVFVCSRSGHHNSESSGVRMRSSGKCGCPYKQTAYMDKPTGKWTILIRPMEHNHQMETPARCVVALSDNERAAVQNYSLEGMQPRIIAKKLSEQRPH